MENSVEPENGLRSDNLANAIEYDEMQHEADDFILDSAAAIVVDDVSGNIIRITREAEEGLGYLENELIGEKLETLIPTDVAARHVELRRGHAGSPATRQMAHGRKVSARMKDGTLRQVTISLKSKFIINKKTHQKSRWTRANIIFSPVESKDVAFA